MNLASNSPVATPGATLPGVRLAGLLGAVGVALGAFGAHGLRDRLPPNLLDVYKTGVLYHLLHAVALLAVALAGSRVAYGRVVRASFVAGIVIFSGSLYALALSGRGFFGAIAPMGGLAFLTGWAALLVGPARSS